MRFMKNFTIVIIILVAMCNSSALKAQRVGISTNLLGIATLSANADIEIVIGDKSSLSIGASGAPWRFNEKISLKHILISPEYKYWFSQAMYWHYLGANFMYTAYRVRFNDKKYEGNIAAFGVTYGYSLILGKRWNFVPSVGLGVGIKTDHIKGTTKLIHAVPKLNASKQYQ